MEHFLAKRFSAYEEISVSTSIRAIDACGSTYASLPIEVFGH